MKLVSRSKIINGYHSTNEIYLKIMKNISTVEHAFKLQK